MSSLQEVGFWAEPDPLGQVGSSWRWFLGVVSAGLEIPTRRPVDQFIDNTWNPRERAAVLTYVRAGHVHQRWMGHSTCRICGEMNGTQDLTDGTYVWPEGFGHYIELHDIRPPDEFVYHVLRKKRLR